MSTSLQEDYHWATYVAIDLIKLDGTLCPALVVADISANRPDNILF